MPSTLTECDRRLLGKVLFTQGRTYHQILINVYVPACTFFLVQNTPMIYNMAFQICAQANQDLLPFLFSKLHPSWMVWYFAWIAASFIITVHVLRHISDLLWTSYPLPPLLCVPSSIFRPAQLSYIIKMF